MVTGLSHITFIVSDLDRMEALLVGILDATKIYESGDQTFSVAKERFFMVGDVWIATMEGNSLPTRTYNHVAFKIDDKDHDKYYKRIEAQGLDILNGRSRVGGEGRSIYFYDHDNHLFELHTGTLETRLKRYTTDNS